MSETTTITPRIDDTLATVKMRRKMRAMDRRAWWHWWNAVLVIMLLMGAVASLSLPVAPSADPIYQANLTLAVRGLLGLILIFNIYMLYQQYLLKALRANLARQIEITGEQEVRAEMFEELSILDPLSGLYNRRYGDDRLRRELARSDRSGDPFILLLLDLDKFKEINDQFGHPAGDLVIKEFAHRLSKSIRGSDAAVRLGGDEFMVILPECLPEKIGIVMSRLSNLEVEIGSEKINVQCSSGWTQYIAADNSESILKRADEALYANKSAKGAISSDNLWASRLEDSDRMTIVNNLRESAVQTS
jgi:diguanylate cyclase (GGDEF)-like protein